MVPLRGVNDTQILSMLEYCLERGFELRFIELMRMGHLALDTVSFARQYFAMSAIFELIDKQFSYAQAPAPWTRLPCAMRFPGWATLASLPMKVLPSVEPAFGCAYPQPGGFMAASRPVTDTP